MNRQVQSLRRQSGRIKDARGRSVNQIDPVALAIFGQHELIDAETLHNIVNEEGVRVTGAERVALIVGVGAALLVTGLFAHALFSGDLRSAPYAKSAGLLYLCSLPWVIWFGIKRKRFSRVAAAMLKYLHCPHCGYDLRMLPRDPGDEATVCPECGCAWLLPSATK
ncbi:MAG: hypothetical protein ACYTHJ_07950 [Planctomycetota bacterium]|jgi:hypothetical protein